MIICVSANPAIDKRLRLERLRAGAVNRVGEVLAAPGGKAAHVAMAAHALGAEVVWVGFLGGASGAAIAGSLTEMGLKTLPVQTQSSTRTNLEIIEADGQITEILEPGGAVEESELAELFAVCQRLFARAGANAQVVLAGSLPPGVPPDFYAQLTVRAHTAGLRVLLDTSGAALLHTLGAAPDFSKPNREEAAQVLGRNVTNQADALAAAHELMKCGVQSVAVSLGAHGLLWLSGQNAEPVFALPLSVAVNSTVGCGDATVAGFAVAHERGWGPEAALGLALACGAANCLAPLPCQITAAAVERLRSAVLERAG